MTIDASHFMYTCERDAMKLATHCAFLYSEMRKEERKTEMFLEEIKAALLEGKSSAFIFNMILNHMGQLRANCDVCS